jgi:hypothetical protein
LKANATTTRRAKRPAARGNALLEFVLTLPIIIFMTGLTIYMAMAMLTKQQALVEARLRLWRAAGWYWPPMKLEGWDPTTDPNFHDPPPNAGHMPRGEGEELDRLYQEVSPQTVNRVSNAKARQYWERLWGNLPGRHETEASMSFETHGRMWDFIEKTAEADHFRDSSPWHYQHLDAWMIARSGPLKEIFDAFRDNLPPNILPDVTQPFRVRNPFEPTREDVYDRWWHGSDILRTQQTMPQGP